MLALNAYCCTHLPCPAYAVQPSVLQERLQMLTCGLGISPARLRIMIVQVCQWRGGWGRWGM